MPHVLPRLFGRGPASGRRLRRPRRPVAWVLAVLLATLTVLAVRHDGLATARVDVNDGGIWVSNGSKQLVGHLNYEARTLDGAFRTTGSQFDIGQARDTVTFNDLALHSLAAVDAAGVRLGSATSLTERTQAVQGGDRMGVLDAATGNLWVSDAREPSATSYAEAGALATDLEGGVVTTAVDGTVIAVAASSAKFVIVATQGETDALTSVPIKELSPSARLTVTAVGNRPVALDSASNSLIFPDGSIHSLAAAGIPDGGRLQLPGPDAPHVLVATRDGLAVVPLDGGTPTLLPADAAEATDGTPAAPVRHQGCDYAAWTGSGAFLRQCGNDADTLRMRVDTLKTAGEVQFRTNRKLIVLNDIGTGTVWLPDNNMTLAADWDEIDSQLKKDDNQEESPQTTEQFADPERKQKNTPPKANDDTFGVRAGRATTLDIRSNDSDQDGDVLTARPVTQPKVGTVSRTRGGQALRLDLPDDATGTFSFVYEASDGQAVDTARVTVTVHPPSENSAPKQLRNPTVKLGSKAEIDYNVLPDWRDPDGDPIYLSTAKFPERLAGQYREEGTVTVRNLGRKPGAVPVTVVVTDGTAATTGELNVGVQAPGNQLPIANADFYVARAGEKVVIEPLANDSDPNGDPLILLSASAGSSGATVIPDLELATVSFSAEATGSYSFTYRVSDGPGISTGIVRVDVVPEEQKSVPVAEDDLVLLPLGGAALSAPLNNDTDPAGGVLVLQSVDVPASAPVKVTLIDHHLLRITSGSGLTRPVTLTYTVSNGTHTAKAKVLLVNARALDDRQPPQLQSDRARVRAGDIGSVLVLANDRSPAGLALRLDTALEYEPHPEIGTPFVTGNQVRLEAGGEAGTLHVAYTVRDTSGNMATAVVTFEVVAQDAANSAPRPKALTAWAVSGQTVRIPVPTAGIDPDGDSVTLLGVAQAPQKGIAVLGTDWLEYTPAVGMTGTDVFTYIVEDRLGKQATARVRVGIAPPSTLNQEPTAVPDTLLVRPDRALTVPVVDNDIDPDGDPIILVPGGLTAGDPQLAPTVIGRSISLRSPHAVGSYPVMYQIGDGRGGTDTGVLTINVTEDALLRAPTPRDDVVAVADVPTDGSPAIVDVLVNDEDPDGDIAKVTVKASAPGVKLSGGKLQIIPQESRRLVVYSITDEDGLTGSAVVSVPGTAVSRPRLDDTKVPVQVRAGQELTLDLTDYVITRSGRSPRLVEGAPVKSSPGSDGPPRVEGDHLILFKTDKKFAGDTSVSFTVADGTTEDRSTLTANLTIPITVQASVNHPPTIVPTAIRVAAGEQTTVDLASMTTDPDGTDPTTLTYELGNRPPRITANVQGSLITVQAAVDQRKGPAGSIELAVKDEAEAVAAQIPVIVVASTKPLIQVPDAYLEANAGALHKVDIARLAINPFPATPLRIRSASVAVGEGEVDPQGTELLITPQAGYHGPMTVVYTLMDATGDPDRIVTGRVKLVVRDRPDPPSDLSVTPTGAGSALITFQPGADNGAPITSFTITDVTTGDSYESKVASRTLTGLTNGIKHSFKVLARNEVGPSDYSETSAPVLIDERPGRPAPPTGEAGDEWIKVSWKPPTNQGSAITGYTLYLTGDDTRVVKVSADDTTHTFSNLRNGGTYRVSVQAHNRAEEPSDVSEPSAGLVPFGPPSPPTSLDHTYVPPDNPDQAKVEISWKYPDSSNGRPWDQVRVTTAAGAKEIATNDSDPVTSTVVEVPPAVESTVSVELHTEAGWSDPRSITFQAASVPVTIAVPTVTATGNNTELSVQGAATKAGNGYRLSQLTLQYNADGDWKTLSGTKITGLTNGTAYDVKFRQVSSIFGALAVGQSVTAAAATPYGPPIAPTLTVTGGDGQVTFHFTATAKNGGPEVVKVTFSGDGPTVPPYTTLSGDYVISNAVPGRNYTVKATACDSEDTCTSSTATGSPWGSISVQSAACVGGEKPDLAAPGDPCHTFEVRPRNWVGTPDLVCTFKSDVEAASHNFTVRNHSTWTRSGLRTNVTDAGTLSGWVGSVLVCRPS